MNFKKFFIHNWPAIFYLNFKLLPIKQAVKFPIDIYGRIKIPHLSGKLLLVSDRVFAGMIKIGSQGSDMFPHVSTVISIEGTVIVGGSLTIGVGSSIISKSCSTLTFSHNTILGARNIIYCKNNIFIGRGFLTSWDCQIMDTDTHAVIDILTNCPNSSALAVKTGEHIWVGNGVTINKGTILPSNTIVASRSLCNKDYSDIGENCILAGSPAKVVSRNKRWKL